MREHNKLTHAVIPTLSEDYFTTQKILTNYQMGMEKNPFFNKLGGSLGISEVWYGAPIPYNLYFETDKVYEESGVR